VRSTACHPHGPQHLGLPSDGTSSSLACVTSQSFRKTTATSLDEAGLSARPVADQLGHARPSMTQDVYIGRRVRNGRAAHALESAIPEQEDDEKCS
jgi:integrase